MIYKFRYKTSANDLWQLSMYGIYTSMLGVVNIIFTIALILLTGKYFTEVGIIFKVIMVIGVLLFTVIQPLMIYLKAKKQVETIKDEVTINFDDQGVHVKVDNQYSDLQWNSIKGVSKRPTMLVVFPSGNHGFILNNKVLGRQKDDLYKYITDKIN